MTIEEDGLREELLDLSKIELVDEVIELRDDQNPVPFVRCIAVRCIGIYKNYDGNAPDTGYFLYVRDQEIAEAACKMLDQDDGGSAYSEGHEWAASWDSQHTVVEEEGNNVFTTLNAMEIHVEDMRDG